MEAAAPLSVFSLLKLLTAGPPEVKVEEQQVGGV